jgi:outer membrane protein TolC
VIPILTHITAALASLALAAAPVAAEDFAMPRVTLDEAIALSLIENPEVRASAHMAEAARAGLGASRSRRLPVLGIEERAGSTDNPAGAFALRLNQGRLTQQDFAIDTLADPDPVTDFQTTLSFELPLFAREIGVGIDMATHEAEAAESDHAWAREGIALAATDAWLGVLAAREGLKAAEAGLADAHEHARLADVRVRTGVGLHADALRTGVFLKEAEERYAGARSALHVARRALGLVLGREIQVDAAGIADITEVGWDLDALTARALDARADLRAMEARARGAERAVAMAGAAYYPTAGVGGAYVLNDGDSPFGAEGSSYQAGAFVRWTIWNGGARHFERERAARGLSATEERLAGMRRQVGFEVYRAYLALDEGRAGLARAEASLGLAMEGLRLVRVRYENGLGSLVDLLDAQRTLDQVRALLVTKKNAVMRAEAELRYRSGESLAPKTDEYEVER